MSSVMSLADVQTCFWRAVRYDPAPADALQHFVGDERLAAAGRLAIYRRMYWYRQVNALCEAFPELREQMGGERFTKMACRYIRKHPSEHPCLELLGRCLPEMIRVDFPELAALAEFEWAKTCALIAPEPPALATVEDIDVSCFGEVRLAFVKSLRVVHCDERALAGCGSDGRTVAVWRRRFGVRHAIVDEAEASALEHALAGCTVAEVLSPFSADDAGIAGALSMIRSWFSRQWIEAMSR